ncbi:hypothetical protein [Microbulbifer sp. ALW1]|uniref:hypothetical protein n=1 Tax=Microbulbifer sp. (strain ALW1) TaxID=1516059 RepID=UPI0013595B98|nr:hypothetical protein [Microbulbifer sp. ALW1]
MWYKRYGYRQPSSNNGIGCIGAAFSVIAAFSIAFGVAFLTKNDWFIWLGVPITFVGFWIAENRFQNEGGLIRKQRFEYHVSKASRYIDSGKVAKAKESIRRAKIYGEIPQELKEFDRTHGC